MLKKNEVVDRMTKVHNSFYFYPDFDYKTVFMKIDIICPLHGKFNQSISSHLSGSGCSDCGKIRSIAKKSSTIKTFLEKANRIHKNKYNYSKVNSAITRSYAIIQCPIHGDFRQRISRHLEGRGCKKCANDFYKINNCLDQNSFIEKCKIIHNNKYDYSLVKYKKSNVKIVIICPIHGEFSQAAGSHKEGRGCPECNLDDQRIGTEKFIERSRAMHGDRYDYSLVEYKNSKSKVKIICPKHGMFKQGAREHSLEGANCPKCRMSRGEELVNMCLENLGLEFFHEFSFKDIEVKRLEFDFCIHYNCKLFLIEFQGQQHFSPNSFFGGEEGFHKTQARDQRKRDFVADRPNVELLEIHYKDIDKIPQLINDFLGIEVKEAA